MICYRSDSHSAPFNIATEEYFLKNFDDDFFLLYQNEPSIIVGKHQNTLAEINLEAIEKENIPVIRRLSGGGTVFHDMGNLNFCFIVNGKKGELVNFRRYTQPILEVLQELGVNAKFEGRNDLTIDGMKFSGNASHVYKNKVMHHGTLLFSSDLSHLNHALKVNPLKFKDKGIRSIRSRVTNISNHLPSSLPLEDFSNRILDHVLKQNPKARTFEMTGQDRENIHNLVHTKYKTWDWNFGYSPRYNFEKLIHSSNGGIVEIHLHVEKGYIRDMELFGNCLQTGQIDDFKEIFRNCPHNPDTIREKLSVVDLNKYFNGITLNQILEGMF